MVAEIRKNTSNLMPRNQIIGILDEERVFISVHEHLNEEELYFSNGVSIFYKQEIDEFVRQLKNIPFSLDNQKLNIFCAVFFLVSYI